MTWDHVSVAAAVVAVVLTVVGMFAQARKSAGDQAAKRAEREREQRDREQARYNQGFEDGKQFRQPDIDLLKSQRDDARRERDNERAERIDCTRHVDELERELRNRGGTP